MVRKYSFCYMKFFLSVKFLIFYRFRFIFRNFDVFLFVISCFKLQYLELGESEFKVINLNMIKNKINYRIYDQFYRFSKKCWVMNKIYEN